MLHAHLWNHRDSLQGRTSYRQKQGTRELLQENGKDLISISTYPGYPRPTVKFSWLLQSSISLVSLISEKAVFNYYCVYCCSLGVLVQAAVFQLMVYKWAHQFWQRIMFSTSWFWTRCTVWLGIGFSFLPWGIEWNIFF
jgi:hypothetical protein